MCVVGGGGGGGGGGGNSFPQYFVTCCYIFMSKQGPDIRFVISSYSI